MKLEENSQGCWPTRASYCENEIIIHVNDNEEEKVAALFN